jgi:all-trans-8'-apo-beta-carotenal 15,15'-oxygenase
MKRRELFAATAAAAALLASTAIHAQASPNYLLPFKGVDDSTGSRDCAELALEGRLPEGLQGRFLRNGPALFERGGVRYQHWFDGDGMVQQYTFAKGRVSHRGRLVSTAKYRAEREAGEFLVPSFGTPIAPKRRITGPDSMNTANTNAIEHGGRLMAMWEGGSAYELDPLSLETKGPITWGEGMEQLPFSAHPKVDARGHLWNVGLGMGGLMVWHVGPDGKLVKAGRVKLNFPAGMAHDMAVTERYVVVPLAPLRLDFAKLGQGMDQAFRFEKNDPMRVLLIDKSDFSKTQIFEAPAEMLFHVGNAHDTADGQVELTYVGTPDAGFLSGAASAVLKGEVIAASPTTLALVRMDPRTGRLTRQALSDGKSGIEFPRVNPRFVGTRARYLITPEARSGTHASHGFTELAVRDLQTQSEQRFSFAKGQVVEEFVSVPKPGASGELDAWLIGSGFDANRAVSTVHVFDARRVADGPLATARLPYWVPFGFHGNFQAT